MMTNKKKKIFVGVSGGVDSSVALALLKNTTKSNFKDTFGFDPDNDFTAFDVTGVFLKVWYPDFLRCDWREERISAMRVCARLEVPFLTIDCEKEYKKEVIDYMIEEYKIGRIPNPDIFCNKYVKFGVFLEKAKNMGADYIATGHYARTFKNNDKIELLQGTDRNKDQSYFLYTLGQNELKHTLFPIGLLKKDYVRKIASKFNLSTAEKKDSQGLCFMGNIDLKDFLMHYIEKKTGNVINDEGNVIGKHDGSQFYTIGQKHGFIINQNSPNESRFMVISKNIEYNTITVTNLKNGIEKKLIPKKILVENLHLISPSSSTSFLAEIRTRYRMPKKKCEVVKTNDGYHITLHDFEETVSLGQSAVIYNKEICLGGGIITKILE